MVWWDRGSTNHPRRDNPVFPVVDHPQSFSYALTEGPGFFPDNSCDPETVVANRRLGGRTFKAPPLVLVLPEAEKPLEFDERLRRRKCLSRKGFCLGRRSFEERIGLHHRPGQETTPRPHRVAERKLPTLPGKRSEPCHFPRYQVCPIQPTTPFSSSSPPATRA